MYRLKLTSSEKTGPLMLESMLLDFPGEKALIDMVIAMAEDVINDYETIQRILDVEDQVSEVSEGEEETQFQLLEEDVFQVCLNSTNLCVLKLNSGYGHADGRYRRGPSQHYRPRTSTRRSELSSAYSHLPTHLKTSFFFDHDFHSRTAPETHPYQ